MPSRPLTVPELIAVLAVIIKDIYIEDGASAAAFQVVLDERTSAVGAARFLSLLKSADRHGGSRIASPNS